MGSTHKNFLFFAFIIFSRYLSYMAHIILLHTDAIVSVKWAVQIYQMPNLFVTYTTINPCVIYEYNFSRTNAHKITDIINNEESAKRSREMTNVESAKKTQAHKTTFQYYRVNKVLIGE